MTQDNFRDEAKIWAEENSDTIEDHEEILSYLSQYESLVVELENRIKEAENTINYIDGRENLSIEGYSKIVEYFKKYYEDDNAPKQEDFISYNGD